MLVNKQTKPQLHHTILNICILLYIIIFKVLKYNKNIVDFPWDSGKDCSVTQKNVAVKWFTNILFHVYPVFKQGELVSDWCAERRRPPIQPALVETMDWSEPVLPSFPVQRDKGAKDRCCLS